MCIDPLPNLMICRAGGGGGGGGEDKGTCV